ncbi:MAG: hypothetical protein AAFZ07_09455 [Actinomycetota bacterium]
MAEALGLETAAPIDVVLFGRREVEIEAQGLLRVEVDGRWGMCVFAAALDETARADAACDASSAPSAVRVQVECDRELGITLVHALFPLCDPERELEVREVVAARAASCAADEVASAVAALERLR